MFLLQIVSSLCLAIASSDSVADFIRCPKDTTSCLDWDCSENDLWKRARIECDKWPYYAGSWGYEWDSEVKFNSHIYFI